MAEQVIETYNLFLSSDDAKSDGQDYTFQLGNNTIQTRGDGQFIRFTLQSFSMAKNWSNLNETNRYLLFRCGQLNSSSGNRELAGTLAFASTIPASNYKDLKDLANEGVAPMFREALKIAEERYTVGTVGGAWTISSAPAVQPTDAGINTTSDNIISATFDWNPNPSAPTSANSVLRQTDVEQGYFTPQAVTDVTKMPGTTGVAGLIPFDGAEIAKLIGCDRLFHSDAEVIGPNFKPSFSVVFDPPTAPTSCTIQMSYPAQRFSDFNVMLRMTPIGSSFASPGMEENVGVSTESNLNPTNILAEMPIQTEMVQYSPNKAREYFVNLYQKQLSNFKIRLTDSHGNPLPYLASQVDGTGFRQTNRGNRYFNMAVRCDILAGSAHSETTKHKAISIPKKFPARFDSNVLMWQKDAMKTLDKPAGYS